jgi:hypothetical protein
MWQHANLPIEGGKLMLQKKKLSARQSNEMKAKMQLHAAIARTMRSSARNKSNEAHKVRFCSYLRRSA